MTDRGAIISAWISMDNKLESFLRLELLLNLAQYFPSHLLYYSAYIHVFLVVVRLWLIACFSNNSGSRKPQLL